MKTAAPICTRITQTAVIRGERVTYTTGAVMGFEWLDVIRPQVQECR